MLQEEKLVITAEPKFIKRYTGFYKALEKYFRVSDFVASPLLKPSRHTRNFLRQVLQGFPFVQYKLYGKKYDAGKSVWGFRYKSAIIQRKLSGMDAATVLQVFWNFLFCAAATQGFFTMSLDYTMQLAAKKLPAVG